MEYERQTESYQSALGPYKIFIFVKLTFFPVIVALFLHNLHFSRKV